MRSSTPAPRRRLQAVAAADVHADAAPPPAPATAAPSDEPGAAAALPVVEAPPAPVAAPAPPAVAVPAASPAPVAAPPEPAKPVVNIDELLAKAQKQEQAKRYNEYVKTLIELAEGVEEPAEKIEYYAKAADLYTSKFSNAAEAVKCFEAILNLDGENAQAIEFLRQSYEKRRDWEKLIGLMRKEAAAMPEGGARGAKFLEIAKLATERVKKPEVCIDLWNEVIANDAENHEALNALAGLHERAKDWTALGVVLQKQVDSTFDAKAKEALLGKLGALYGERLNDDAAAVEAWRQLLALNPQDRKAQEALKKKYLTLGRWDDLEVFYAESGKWDEFIRVLESQEAKETDDQAKISLLMKIAELWMAQKGKPDRAARAYEKVLSLDAKHLAAAEALIPLYEQAGNAKGLAGAIEVKLLHDQPDATKLELFRQVAGLYETKLKEPQQAFERYLAAFELAPGDARCIEDVERAARATSGWAALIATYGQAVARADEAIDHELAIALRLRLGHVLRDEVKRVDEALAQFRAVYDADGENADAIGALEQLYRDTSRFTELLGIYEKKRDLTPDPLERRPILYAIAVLYENELKDPSSAVGTYLQVLDDERMDSQALAALDKLYRAQEKWEEYADVLRKRIEIADEELLLIDLKYRLGVTLEKHLHDPSGALDNYREILLIDAGNDAARAALEAMLENADLRAEAAGILEEIYESRSDWEKLIHALEILAAAADDVSGRVRLLRKVARTAAESLNDLGRAFDAEARALKDDPANLETRTELEQLAERAGAWGKLDVIFSEIADGISDAQLARGYWMRLAAIDERLGKVDEAAANYLRVLAIDPADQEALAAMDALYTRTERWSDLIGVYRRRIELASDGPESEKLYAQMAEVYETQAPQARGRHRRLPRGAQQRRDLERRPHCARRAVHPPGDVGEARGQPRRPAPPRLRRGRADPAHAAARRAARVEDEHDRAGDRDLQPDPRARAREHRGARRAGAARQDRRARAAHRRDPRAALSLVGRLRQAHRRARGAGASQRRPCPPRRAAPPDRHPPRGRGERCLRCVRHLRSRPRGGSGRARHAGGPRSSRSRHRPLRRSGAGLRDARRQAGRHRAGEPALHDERAGLRVGHR